MPSAAAGPGGTFSLSWKGFDGERYVARSIGDQVDVPSRGAAPPGVYERALDARLPPETAVAWTGPDALSRSVYLKQLADEQAAPTDEKQKGASRDGVASVPGAITIVAFGDSITYGRGSESNGPRTGYPVYLRAILSYNYPGRIFTTVNEGVPGETTEGGLGRIDDVLIESRPQYILIMEGTNDMFMGVSFETVQENLKQMAFRAAARGAVPILATIIPTDPHTRPEQYLRTRSFYTGGYVQSIHDYYSIPYADQWNAFCSIPDFAETLMDPATGNHPNDNGYRYVMAPEWYDALAPVLGLPFDPVPPQLDLDESAQSVTRGASEEFSYALVPSNDMVRNAVDCYVALRSPDGALTFYNPNRQPTPRTTPIARKVLLTAVPDAGHLLQLPIDWGASLGTYTLYLVTVRALHDPWITSNWTSNLAQIQFEVKQ
jgi:lysophospholipase L1-like esterase